MKLKYKFIHWYRAICRYYMYIFDFNNCIYNYKICFNTFLQIILMNKIYEIVYMWNHIDCFFYYIESHNECLTSNCQIISSLSGLLLLPSMEYHNETNNPKKLFVCLARFSSKRYMYLWFLVYACMKVSIYKEEVIPVYEHTYSSVYETVYIYIYLG